MSGKQQRLVIFNLDFWSPGYFMKILQRLAHEETREDVTRASFGLKIEQMLSFKEQI